jgi:protein-S-isoprenylcysteine O-methyltransferase Ste14
MRREDLLQTSEHAAHSSAVRWASPTSAKSSLGTIQSWLSRRKLPRVKLLDVFERVVLLVVFGHFAFVMLTVGKAGVLSFMLLVSESLPVFLVLTRRKANALSDKPLGWFLALVGTTLPLLALPVGSNPLVPAGLSGAIMLIGLYVQISAKVILGRSFGLIAANRGIKVAGPYRIVRHPIYAGYIITHVGFLLAFPSLWNLGLYSTQWVVQVARLLREEHLLKQDPNYRNYAASVRYRLFPMIF